jgi:hypothetical protein
VSCPSAGNCAAAGGYAGDGGPAGAWVMNEKSGRWGSVHELTRTSEQGSATSVSCWSRGNCVAAGSFFLIKDGVNQAFVVTEKNGRWGSAEQVSGLAALSKGAGDQILSVSCPSPGACSAGGSYGYTTEGFVVSRVN